MDLDEFSTFFRLNLRLERERETLRALASRADIHAQALDGMPRRGGMGNLTAEIASAMADTEREMEALAKEARVEYARIQSRIEKIEDVHTRNIFRLRFLACMTWDEVAAAIGGGNTANGVKALCYRYLKKL